MEVVAIILAVVAIVAVAVGAYFRAVERHHLALEAMRRQAERQYEGQQIAEVGAAAAPASAPPPLPVSVPPSRVLQLAPAPGNTEKPWLNRKRRSRTAAERFERRLALAERIERAGKPVKRSDLLRSNASQGRLRDTSYDLKVLCASGLIVRIGTTPRDTRYVPAQRQPVSASNGGTGTDGQ